MNHYQIFPPKRKMKSTPSDMLISIYQAQLIHNINNFKKMELK